MPTSGSKPEGRLDRNKGTEHSRLILGLTSSARMYLMLEDITY